MPTAWRLLADAVVGVHFAFLGYLVVGGFLTWRWPRTILLHAAAVVWGALIVLVRLPCPLTGLQNKLRVAAGEPPLRNGFIDAYLTGRIYPVGDGRLVQVLVALVVLGSWAAYAVRRRRGSAPPGQPARDRLRLVDRRG